MAFCSNCGTEMSDLAAACPSCGHPTARARPAPVPNYLVQAILVTIFCCLPFGIVSIVYSSQVNSKLAAGDFEGAVAASNNARKWAWIALIAGIVFGIGGAIMQIGNGPDFNMVP
jgi:hypothetical protein